MLNWDIAIAVINAAVAIGTAYYGVHVAMHPESITGAKKIHRLKIEFLCLGLVSCSLIALQTWRTSESQENLMVIMRQIGNNSGSFPRFLTSTKDVSFGLISDGTCSGDQIVPLKGARPRDASTATLERLPQGVVLNSYSSKDDEVNVRACNWSGGSIAINSVVVRVAISR